MMEGGLALAPTQVLGERRVVPPRGHTRDPEDTERRLLDAALAVFGRAGYGAATVNEIVRQAGCSKGAFYVHFASKEELFLHLLEQRMLGNHERLLQLCPWQGSCAQWVTDMFLTMVGFGAGQHVWRSLGAEFMAHSLRDPRIAQRISDAHQVLRDLIADTLRRCALEQGQTMAAEPETIAAVLVALLDGIALHTSMEPDRLPLAETLEGLKPLLAAWFPKEPS